LWILEADLTAAFDRIDHQQLLAAPDSFPPETWSKAG
jgi:retron-type reverse transcriptase